MHRFTTLFCLALLVAAASAQRGNPSAGHAENEAALAAFAEQRYADAADAFRKAALSLPTDPAPLDNLAAALMALAERAHAATGAAPPAYPLADRSSGGGGAARVRWLLEGAARSLDQALALAPADGALLLRGKQLAALRRRLGGARGPGGRVPLTDESRGGLPPRERQRWAFTVPRLQSAELTPDHAVFAGDVPFVLTDAMEGWGALEPGRWTMDALAKRFPDSIVDFYPANMQRRGNHPFLTPLSLAASEYHVAGHQPKYVQWRITLPDWLRLKGDAKDGDSLPEFFWHETEWLPKCMPNATQAELERAADNLMSHCRWHMVSFGEVDSGMFFHPDGFASATFHAQVVGRKRWDLCMPATKDPALRGRSRTPFGTAGDLNTFDPDYDQHPDFADATCGQVTVKPSEILFYPAHWWHHTLSLDNPTVGLARRQVDAISFHETLNSLQYDCDNPGQDISKQWPGAAPLLSDQTCRVINKCHDVWQEYFVQEPKLRPKRVSGGAMWRGHKTDDAAVAGAGAPSFMDATGRWIAAHSTAVIAVSVGASLGSGLLSQTLGEIINIAPARFTPEASDAGMLYDALATARKDGTRLRSTQAWADAAKAAKSVKFRRSLRDVRGASSFGTFILCFVGRDGQSVLSDAALTEIKGVEDAVKATKGYTDFCRGDGKGGCSPISSVSAVAFSGEGGALIPSAEATLSKTSSLRSLMQAGAGTSATPVVNTVRSFVAWGSPIPGYSSINDRNKEQRDKLYEYQKDELVFGIIDDHAAKADRLTNLVYTGPTLWKPEMDYYTLLDASWGGGSLVLVTIYARVHTGSWFLALMLVSNVVMAMPPAYCIYRYVFGFLMNGLNFMALFVVIGIGADDAFIVADGWAQARRTSSITTTDQRAGFVFARAVPAMATTSITTMAAFMATSISTIPAIFTFGFFAASVVLCNYLLICTFYIAAVSKWDAGCCCGCVAAPPPPSPGDEEADQRRPTEKFLEDSLAPWLHAHRKPLLSSFAMIVLVACVIASGLETESTEKSFLPDDSNLANIGPAMARFPLSSTSDLITVTVSVGIKTIDRDKMDKSDRDDRGEVVFDAAFSATRVQASFVQLCDAVSKVDKKWLQRVNGCVVQKFKKWVLANNKTAVTWPLPEATYNSAMMKWLTSGGGGYISYAGMSLAPRVQYLAFSFVTTLNDEVKGKVRDEHFEFWDAFFREFKASHPQLAKLQMTSIAWRDKATMDTLVNTALYGMSISVLLAAVVMAFATRDVILTAFATLTIACIVVTLVAAYVLMGVTMGFMESINLAFVAGLAVDYTLHLAHAYRHSPRRTRLERSADSLGVIGISVVNGCATTLLASGFLFFAFIRMSVAFGLTIFISVSLSLFYAFFMFMTLLVTFGPENLDAAEAAADIQMEKVAPVEGA